MSNQVRLEAEARAGSGKGEARSLRRQGRVPAIAYGRGLDPTPLSVDGLELFRALHTDAGENVILSLEFDGQRQLAMARELQRHPVRRDVLHADFVTISADVTVTVDVPIALEGEAAGADEGGVAEQALYALHVEVLPLEVPDQISVDISALQVGDVLRVADLTTPSGVEVLDDPDETVVTVNVPQIEVPEPGEEGLEEAEVPAEAEGAEGEEAPTVEAEAAQPPDETGAGAEAGAGDESGGGEER